MREMKTVDGVGMILCNGGMSVDPDDRTPAAIREVCGRDKLVSYGAPVLPGSMFLLVYYGKSFIPVMRRLRRFVPAKRYRVTALPK